MDIISSFDADCSAFAGLFQSIMIDLKNSGPMWEDFISKTSKLHNTLKTVLVAFSSFLDAFQRIADAATNARGATKDVGASLTRLSLRHRAIESKVKTLTSSLLECLVSPLQEKLEDWKRVTLSLDKHHTKEYKRCRADIKKRAENTARLQRKAKKSGKTSDFNTIVDSSMNDLSSRLSALQESEKSAVRRALTEERSRFCTFASALKPVLVEEIGLVSELGHLQEVVIQMEKHSSDPRSLPPASEQVLEDAKAGETKWTWQTPPSSPTSSLGSRKSSMCSISSINSSSSSSIQSPAHHLMSSSQGHRLASVCSQDSGFISQDTLHRTRRQYIFLKTSGLSDNSGGSADSHKPPPAPQSTATWPNVTDAILHHKSVSTSVLHDFVDRPHTISTAYERGKDRLPLTVYTFQPPNDYTGQISSQPVSPVCVEKDGSICTPFPGYTATISKRSSRTSLQQNISSSSQESLIQMCKPRPPIPSRCASLDRPDRPQKTIKQKRDTAKKKFIRQESKTLDRNFIMPDFNMAASDMVLPQPLYSNMEELAATGKGIGLEGDISSLTSSGYGSQPNMVESSYRSDIESGCHNSVRPHSLAVLPQSILHSQLLSQTGTNSPRCGSLRRGHKPPPPIRRTSSITSTSSLAMTSNSGRSTPSIPSPISLNDACISQPDHVIQIRGNLNPSPAQLGSGSSTPTPVGSGDSFPPPPAYLLELGEGKDADLVTPEGIRITDEIKPQCIQDECLKNRTSSVSETIKCLQDNHHMPPSPISLRRAQSLLGSNSIIIPQFAQTHREERRQSLENARAALITSLNARLSHSPPESQTVLAANPQRQSLPGQRTFSSPKLQRMRLTSVQEAIPGDLQQLSKNQRLPTNVGGSYIQVGRGGQCREPLPDTRSNKTGSLQFLQNLNIVLAQRPTPGEFQSPVNSNPSSPKSKLRRRNLQCASGCSVQRTGSSASEKAFKVRQWIAGKTVKNTDSMRESLLDQIRRGKSLKKTKHVADRSAPRVL